MKLAERVGFEPTCPLRDKTLSRRPRYDHFGTSPQEDQWRRTTHFTRNWSLLLFGGSSKQDPPYMFSDVGNTTTIRHADPNLPPRSHAPGARRRHLGSGSVGHWRDRIQRSERSRPLHRPVAAARICRRRADAAHRIRPRPRAVARLSTHAGIESAGFLRRSFSWRDCSAAASSRAAPINMDI